MVCEHLSELENELSLSGAKETFRGEAWSSNCREWVYYDVVLNLNSIAERIKFAESVVVHENNDERSGLERGFVCKACNDAIMGRINGAELFN